LLKSKKRRKGGREKGKRGEAGFTIEHVKRGKEKGNPALPGIKLSRVQSERKRGKKRKRRERRKGKGKNASGIFEITETGKKKAGTPNFGP